MVKKVTLLQRLPEGSASVYHITQSAHDKIQYEKENLKDCGIFANIFHERGHIVCNRNHGEDKKRFKIRALSLGFTALLLTTALPLSFTWRKGLSIIDMVLISINSIFVPRGTVLLFNAWLSRKDEIEADQYAVDRLNDREALRQFFDFFKQRADSNGIFLSNPFSDHPSDISRAEFFKIAAEKKCS